MSKLEYWFLDTAVEDVIGFSWVVPDERNCLAINRAPINLNIAEIADILETLFQKGDLLAVLYADLNFSKGFIPSREQIEAGLEQRLGINNLGYFLTPQGGEKWESVSKPNWNKYFTGATGQQEGYLMSASKVLLETYLEMKCLAREECYISGTEVWETLIPWQATYWKSLPIGHKVHYQYREHDIIIPSELDERYAEYQQANEWLSGIRKWYTNYFKEP
jgi:hypothetical protein